MSDRRGVLHFTSTWGLFIFFFFYRMTQYYVVYIVFSKLGTVLIVHPVIDKPIAATLNQMWIAYFEMNFWNIVVLQRSSDLFSCTGHSDREIHLAIFPAQKDCEDHFISKGCSLCTFLVLVGETNLNNPLVCNVYFQGKKGKHQSVIYSSCMCSVTVYATLSL